MKPPLPEILQLPIELSEANEKWIQSTPEQVLEVFSLHTFPFTWLFYLFFFLLVLYLVSQKTPQSEKKVQRVALRALRQGFSQDSYVTLTNTLRSSLKIEGITTEEISTETLPHLDKEILHELQNVLKQSDLVKFAKQSPSSRQWKRVKTIYEAILK